MESARNILLASSSQMVYRPLIHHHLIPLSVCPEPIVHLPSPILYALHFKRCLISNMTPVGEGEAFKSGAHNKLRDYPIVLLLEEVGFLVLIYA